MAKSKSSKRWLQEHFSNKYVKKAQQSGYRSRASYKLLEIDKKDNLFYPGMKIIELGSAPGGWSQVAVEKTKNTAKIIACDLLEMKPLQGVTFFQGDFTEEDVYHKMLNSVGNERADLVISDMAPNISGIKELDQNNIINLAELVLDFSSKALKNGGTLVIKVFQGTGFEVYYKKLRKHFKNVISRKPDASRSCSREIYLVAKKFHGVKNKI